MHPRLRHGGGRPGALLSPHGERYGDLLHLEPKRQADPHGPRISRQGHATRGMERYRRLHAHSAGLRPDTRRSAGSVETRRLRKSFHRVPPAGGTARDDRPCCRNRGQFPGLQGPANARRPVDAHLRPGQARSRPTARHEGAVRLHAACRLRHPPLLRPRNLRDDIHPRFAAHGTHIPQSQRRDGDGEGQSQWCLCRRSMDHALPRRDHRCGENRGKQRGNRSGDHMEKPPHRRPETAPKRTPYMGGLPTVDSRRRIAKIRAHRSGGARNQSVFTTYNFNNI